MKCFPQLEKPDLARATAHFFAVNIYKPIGFSVNIFPSPSSVISYLLFSSFPKPRFPEHLFSDSRDCIYRVRTSVNIEKSTWACCPLQSEIGAGVPVPALLHRSCCHRNSFIVPQNSLHCLWLTERMHAFFAQANPLSELGICIYIHRVEVTLARAPAPRLLHSHNATSRS